jgi:hypothetical protein
MKRSQFNMQNYLIPVDPSQYGKFQEVCGKTYLFGKTAVGCHDNSLEIRLIAVFQVTWKQNWMTCCSLGMMPIIFEDIAERNCLSTATQGPEKIFEYLILLFEFEKFA